MRRLRHAPAYTLLLASLQLAGCASQRAAAESSAPTGAPTGSSETVLAERSASDGDDAPAPATSDVARAEPEAAPPPAAEPAAPRDSAPGKAEAVGMGGLGVSGAGPGGGGMGSAVATGRKASSVAPRPGPAAVDVPRQRSGLQGGSRDDVAQRQDYLRYLREYAGPEVHRVDVSQRVMVNVMDEMETGLPNARVSLVRDGRVVQSVTSAANGRAQLFPRAAGLKGNESVEVRIESQGRQVARTVDLGGRDDVVGAVLPVLAQRQAPVVDLMFVIDTTGSMGDEISRIQTTLLDVAARIQRLEPSATIRYGLTLYRDRGDEYVTQVRDFTTDVRAFLGELQQVTADGGGDTPEALNEGLHAALHGAHWTTAETPNALRLMVLVADAPPHLDYEQDHDYAREMRLASERGIKIFPVAASGLDDQGEYVFRQLAHHTQGRFVFITYGGGTSHHVGQFANNNLDDLVVGLVADEMADLMGRPRSSVRALAMAR